MTHSSTLSGLTHAEVRERVARGETNDVRQRTSRSIASIIRENVLTLFNAILISAAVLVLIFGHPQDVVFGGVLIINAIIGIASELKAKRTLDSLAIVDAPTALVIRDGKTQEILAKDVVLDDVMCLELGTQICADGIVEESSGLEVDEALLTGESTPVKKKVGDQVLAGTSVVAGSALMVAHAVGAQTYAQDLSRRARVYTRTISHIQVSINKVLRVISALLIPVIVLTMWSQTRIAGTDAAWNQAIVLAVASVVGMIPQGLVLLTSMNFAIGSATLARRGVLVQELPAVEVLARVDSVCVDKTGTLTTGHIRVRTLRIGANVSEDEATLALKALSANRANATAQAIDDYYSDADLGQVNWAIPFSSARKWSACGTTSGSWYLGAPEILRSSEEPGDFDQLIDEYSAEGLRVVALARSQECDEATAFDASSGDYLLPDTRCVVGIIVLEEDLRLDVADTLTYFARQDVRVRVISGDNPVTVGALARQAGLSRPDGKPLVITDARTLPIDTLSDEFGQIVEKTDVFGRVTPEQKRAMVQALQANGHTVAMTGDGVNDALALKDSDLGIAMGNGSQATKAVAQIVLIDSKFAVLPGVVGEGRRIIANMERVCALFLAKTVYAALIVVTCALMAWEYPFLPRHFTYIDALTIGIPAFFLALAPNARRYVPGFLHRTLALALPAGIALTLAALGSYAIVGPGDEYARTIATLSLIVGALWLVSVTARPLLGWRGGLVLLMALGAFMGVSIPTIRTFLALSWPTHEHWLVIGVSGVGAGLLIEASHRLYHKRQHAHAEAIGASDTAQF